MLDFCYDKKNDVRVLGVKTCLHYSQLYTLGDKYGMPVLQRISSKGLTGLLKDVFPLKKAGKIEPAKIEPEIVKDLLATIAHIYHNTLHNDPLRKRLACVPWKSLTMSLYKDQCMEVLRDNPDYAWDVIIYSGDKIEDYSEYWPTIFNYSCPNCDSVTMLNHEMASNDALRCYDCGSINTVDRFAPDDTSDKPERREADLTDC